MIGHTAGLDVCRCTSPAPYCTLRGAQSLVDLTGVYRVWNPRYKSWSVFSQDHLARVLLDWRPDAAGHDAVLDALKSVRLFNLYSQLQASPDAWQSAQVRHLPSGGAMVVNKERTDARLAEHVERPVPSVCASPGVARW